MHEHNAIRLTCRCSGVSPMRAQLQLPLEVGPILQDRLVVVHVIIVIHPREPEDPRAVGHPPGQRRRATPPPALVYRAHLRLTMPMLTTLTSMNQ